MRLDTTEGKDKKNDRGTGEQRKTDANRHGARGLRKLRETRTKKPTNFVPEDVDRAQEDRRRVDAETKMVLSVLSVFPQRRRPGKRRKEGRKEGRSQRCGRSARGRQVYPRVTAIDLMRKMLGAAQKSTPRGGSLYSSASLSLSLRLFRLREGLPSSSSFAVVVVVVVFLFLSHLHRPL